MACAKKRSASSHPTFKQETLYQVTEDESFADNFFAVRIVGTFKRKSYEKSRRHKISKTVG